MKQSQDRLRDSPGTVQGAPTNSKSAMRHHQPLIGASPRADPQMVSRAHPKAASRSAPRAIPTQFYVSAATSFANRPSRLQPRTRSKKVDLPARDINAKTNTISTMLETQIKTLCIRRQRIRATDDARNSTRIRKCLEHRVFPRNPH